MGAKGTWLILILVIGFSVVKMTEWANSLKEGGSFLHGRDYLLRHGWQVMIPSDGKEANGSEIISALAKRHIDEVESCSTDSRTCIFKYKKKSRCIKVIADFDGLDLNKMKVISISAVCSK